MKIILCDIEAETIAAWRVQFARHPDVEVREAAAAELECDAIVNPGNSFGFMDSGLALELSERFGFGFEDTVRKAVREKYGGEMLVGQGEVFPTGGRPPYLVYAPAMRTPQAVKGTLNAYLAARGALSGVRAFNAAGERIKVLAFPALCGGPGQMPPLIAARQLRYAFEEALGLRKIPDQNLSRLARREKKLKSLPGSTEDEE